MAVPVARPRAAPAQERLPLYGARAGAFAGYAAALVAGAVLLAPMLAGDDGATARAPVLPEPVLTKIQRGETVHAAAAREGVSMARLLALNPELTPLGPREGRRVRVR